jgi:hypothetical protein
MSLTRFVKRPEVVAKIKPFRPKLPRKIDAPLKVAPRTERHTLVGTAFDYLLRFEIQRRVPHAIATRLVAEIVPYEIWHPAGFFSYLWMDANQTPPEEAEEVAKTEAERSRKVVEKAKAVGAAYTKMKKPDRVAQADLAGHAIRLAKLENFYRSGQFDRTFENADPEDVEELIDLLAVVPWDELVHDKILLLNPTFGESSSLVGGADADLIAGNTLIDLKTTKKDRIEVVYLDQLLGYFLLARNQHRTDPTFPVIKRFAIYFCRHGHVWAQDATLWTSCPDFPELERWFFDHAKEVLSEM